MDYFNFKLNHACSVCRIDNGLTKLRTFTQPEVKANGSGFERVEKHDYFCQSCWDVKQVSDKKRQFTAAERKTIQDMAKPYWIATAIMALVVALAMVWAHYEIDNTAWWMEGTKANKTYMKGAGTPCDYENDKNCEVS